MDGIINQSVGIDISKLTFTACLATKTVSGKLHLSKVCEFENNKTGFNQLIKWSRKESKKDISLLYLMEATGIYYESLAYFLTKIKQNVTVCLPVKSKFFGKSLNIKTKNDIIDAQILAQFGVDREHRLWVAPKLVYRQLREVTRLHRTLKDHVVMLKNRLEAIEYSASDACFVKKMNNSLLKTTENKINECEEEIKKLVKSDLELDRKVKNLMTIKGVGLITVVIIIAETLGFMHINSRKQLASYAGFDVVEQESGTSIKGKTRISKKGNSRIRAALYFPALSAVRFNKQLKENYNRIIEKKQFKKIGLIAIERKLLLLIYSIWKSEEQYDPTR